MSAIGDVIRRYRQRAFLTQKELAVRIGVRYQTVQSWEAGTAQPRLRYRRALAEALQIPPEQLTAGEKRKLGARAEEGG